MADTFKRLADCADFRIYDCIYAANKKSDFHTDRLSRVSILMAGQLKEEALSQEVFARTSSVVVKPGDIRHRNVFGPQGARILTISFKEPNRRRYIPSEVMNWRWQHGLPAAAFGVPLLQGIMNTRDIAVWQDHIFDFLGAMLTDPSPHPSPPDWIRLLEERIQDEYTAPLRTNDLAQAIDLHPVYLARIFRQCYGTGIQSYIQQLRIKRALHHLSSTDTPLVHIALQHGFADQSHFNRVFKTHTGLSPGAWRNMVRTL